VKQDNVDFEVIIIGGGLAGLTAAIDLSQNNIKVLLIEKDQYPKHRVCGEYVSNEVLPYLNYLNFDPFKLGAKCIKRFELSTITNKVIEAELPLGGFGLSRFAFDKAMADIAEKNGVQFLHDNVLDVTFEDDQFYVETKLNGDFTSQIAIGAYGKRANLDMKLRRDFIEQKSPYLAVKTHLRGDFPDDLVALHNFKGGYCGVSKVEDDSLNVCYITDYEAIKGHKNISVFEKEVVLKNTHLAKIFSESEPIFKEPLTISQISFSHKAPVEDHMIMCGDSAGLIHPLCGNGMGMAIRSAYLASELIKPYLGRGGKREDLEKAYESAWQKEFKLRLRVGHTVASLFRRNNIADMLTGSLNLFPGVLPSIITLTHGKPMQLS
jgi:flavin-dependent dehydrogenase